MYYISSFLFYTGTGFTGVSTVMTGSVECTTTTSTETQIDCTLGNHAAEIVDLIVHVSDKGKSAATQFTFTLAADTITPTTGKELFHWILAAEYFSLTIELSFMLFLLYLCEGSFGGGQLLTIDGAGFDESVSITICGDQCMNKNVSSTQVTCVTPPAGKIFENKFL